MLFPFVLYWLCASIREQRPQEWAAHGGGASAAYWIVALVFRRVKLDNFDRASLLPLRLAQLLLDIGVFELLVALGMIGWALAPW